MILPQRQWSSTTRMTRGWILCGRSCRQHLWMDGCRKSNACARSAHGSLRGGSIRPQAQSWAWSTPHGIRRPSWPGPLLSAVTTDCGRWRTAYSTASPSQTRRRPSGFLRAAPYSQGSQAKRTGTSPRSTGRTSTRSGAWSIQTSMTSSSATGFLCPSTSCRS